MAVTCPLKPAVRSPLNAAMQNESLPTTCTTPLGLSVTTFCIWGVMSAVPSATGTMEKSKPAFLYADVSSKICVAAGTSITTAVAFFAFCALAAPMMRFWKADGPAPKTKVEVGSASSCGVPAAKMNTGMPASCNGCQAFKANWFEPKTTAATSSWIIWFAQSALLPGSPLLVQMSRVIGWPPTPLRYWLIHLTAASETGVSMLLSVPDVFPSVIRPILTGVPVAGVFVPSALSDDAACAGAANAAECDRGGDQQREQARRASARVAVHGSPQFSPERPERRFGSGRLQRRKPSFPAVKENASAVRRAARAGRLELPRAPGGGHEEALQRRRPHRRAGRCLVDRVPQRFREEAPRIVEEGDVEYWLVEGERMPTVGLNAVAGKPENWTFDPVRFSDMIPGCYDASARVADMRAEGIVASINFPSLPRFGGALFPSFRDKELADVCVRAWNDFMMDEWCAAGPEMFVPMAIVQLWDPAAAVSEIERLLERGLRAITIPEETSNLGLPSYYTDFWDPIWSLCEEAGITVCMHIGSSGWRAYTPPEASPSLTVALGFVPTITHARRDDVRSGAPEVPRHQDRLLRGRHQLGAVRARARRSDVRARTACGAVTTTSCRRRSCAGTCGSA